MPLLALVHGADLPSSTAHETLRDCGYQYDALARGSVEDVSVLVARARTRRE
jgi:hypothetical protein